MLTTPIMLLTTAWDASQTHTFNFNVIGGDQVTKNRLVIRDQSTNNIVYDQTQTTFKYEHLVIPPNGMQNGKYYSAQVQTFNAQGASSALSLPIQFWCYSVPTIEFTNMPVDRVIRNITYSFDFIYNQAQGEVLDFWEMRLYDSGGHLLTSSGSQYPANPSVPLTGSYLIEGLDDNATYSIKIVGATINGTVVESEEITFTVDYERPSQFAVLQLENNACEGYIRITSNAAIIDGKSNPSPPVYIDDCTKVDARPDGYWVMWDEGCRIDGNWTIGIWGSEYNINKPLFLQWTPNNTDRNPERLEITYNESWQGGTDQQLYSFVKMKVWYRNQTPHVVYSNLIPAVTTEQIFIWARRIDNLFDLRIENLGVV